MADFGSPIWFNSKHTNLVYVQLNEALRIVSGIVRATPLVWLPELRRKKALCNLIFKTNQLENSILFDFIQDKLNQRLKSRECAWQIFDDVKQFNINEHWT